MSVQVSTYKCNLCEYTTTQKICLRHHNESVHDGLIHRCPFESCPSFFRSKYNINHHIRELHENNKVKCISCDYVASTKYILRKHIQIHHCEKKFSCPDCDYKAGVQYLVNKHYKRKHREGVKCDISSCSRIFKNDDCLRGHINSYHSKKQNNPRNRKIIVCDTCEFKTKNHGKLVEHVRVKHQGEKIKCNECEKEFNWSNDRRMHMSAIHEGIVHSCTLCDYKANFKANLRIHMKKNHLGCEVTIPKASFNEKVVLDNNPDDPDDIPARNLGSEYIEYFKDEKEDSDG